MEEAAEWFALLRSGEATEADRHAWQSWLQAGAAQRSAWAYVERVSRRFAPIRASADPQAAAAVLQTARAQLVRRRQLLLGAAALGGSGLLGWALWRHTPLPAMTMAWTADYRTGTGETRQLALPDGTRVWLASASALDQDYRADLRRLRLVAGDIFIETAADARPFVVDTPQGRLRALGTRFNVRLESEQTAVAVYEGAVEVRTMASDGRLVLQAGQQARFDRHTVRAAGPADAAGASWIHGMLIAQDMPLSEVAAELARYRHGHLGVAPAVARLRVYGSFPLQDTDRALAMLAAILPIRVRHPLPWWSTIEARPAAHGAGATL
ncbi:iron dicitrate transport regulator FecR [Candidimonas nitroreducens]|uniref:Iron dicitrate transport regulator FecR n=2 Tax=Candidimonas nitroreducens TaxID=683354 RepID=A0A225MFT8_9BURK|nr:iron dicitrate transport regulator FecR [Candidimonas nitroreducens]